MSPVLLASKQPGDRPSSAGLKKTLKNPSGFAYLRASVDGKIAYKAVCRLATTPADALARLKACLKPMAATDADCFERLVTNLGSDQFKDRETATNVLGGMGLLAEPTLRKVLATNPPEEMRARVKNILSSLPGAGVKHPGTLRAIRAVHILQRIGTADAWQLLEALAKGSPSCQTLEAKAIVERRPKS